MCLDNIILRCLKNILYQDDPFHTYKIHDTHKLQCINKKYEYHPTFYSNSVRSELITFCQYCNHFTLVNWLWLILIFFKFSFKHFLLEWADVILDGRMRKVYIWLIRSEISNTQVCIGPPDGESWFVYRNVQNMRILLSLV